MIMELAATITGYLVIAAICVFVITMCIYWSIHRIIDALGVRDTFLQMRRERDEARNDLRQAKRGRND